MELILIANEYLVQMMLYHSLVIAKNLRVFWGAPLVLVGILQNLKLMVTELRVSDPFQATLLYDLGNCKLGDERYKRAEN